jgi:chromosome segregation ATPase
MSSLDITDDWQQRAKRASDAEHELANQRRQLNRVWKENRRLRQQVEEYCEALGRSTRDCTQLMSQCQQLSNANIGLARENEKAKFMVETLETVILMLHGPTRKEATQAADGSRDSEPAIGERAEGYSDQ